MSLLCLGFHDPLILWIGPGTGHKILMSIPELLSTNDLFLMYNKFLGLIPSIKECQNED
jgi:hypothetical protein